MKKLLPPLLWLALILTIGFSIKSAVRAIRETAAWEADTTRVYTQIEVDRIAKDSVDAVEARRDTERDSLMVVANQRAVARWNAQREGDSLRRVLQEAHNPSDSLDVTLRLAQRYQVALGEAQGENASLRAVIQSQTLSLVRLKVSEAQAWAHIDSLQALMRRKPGGCKVLGLFACPVPVVAVGLGSKGLDGFVGVGIPLGHR